MSRRILATIAFTLLAGCASAPRERHAALPAPPVAGYPADLATLKKPPNSDERKDRKARKEAGIPGSIEYNLMMESDERGPPSAAQLLRALEQRKSLVRESASSTLKSAGLQPSQWQALGPSNVAGRVRTIAFDPREPARLLVGTASGGLWVSSNGGATWRANQDFLPNLSITTIAFDPIDPAVVYAGTGEANQGHVGIGVFKSTDGGNTWRWLESTNVDANANWRYVNRIALHPTQPGLVLAAVTNASRTTGAVYRSTDGGATWRLVSSSKALDIAFEPGNPSNALAGLDNGRLMFSRDAGLTWTFTDALVAAPSGRQNTARAEIAFAHSQAGVAYASIDNAKGEVWRSANSGATWTKISTPGHLASQGDYDNAIWVDPTDANHVVIGGLDVHQSRDGGVTFNRVSDGQQEPSSPHNDHHALVSPPNFGSANPVLYSGNDGGVYRATNIYAVSSGGWVNLNDGLAVTQFYSGGGRAGRVVVGGTQDNGSLMLASNRWSRWFGGDGGSVAVDPQNDQILYGEYVYASVFRSLTGGGGATYICAGITEAYSSEGGAAFCGSGTTKEANFVAPLVLDPNNPSRLLVGANSLWATANARSVSVSWRAIKPPSAASANYINAVAVAEGNSNVIWVGHNNGEVYRALDGTATSPTWSRMGAGTIPGRLVNRILVDRENHNRVIVALSGFSANNLWQTLDGGATWTSITGNLPSTPVFDVKRHPSNGQWLYAATSVGVYTSENGGATWSTTNEGPANIRVRELFWIDNATLGAATYGRGMFKVSVANAGPANYQDLWWGGAAENGWGMSITQHGSILFAALYIYDPQGKPLWVVMPGGTWNAGLTSFTGALYVPSGSFFGNYDVNRFSANAPVGNATITFSGPGDAILTYSVNGVSGTKAMVRQPFGVPDTTPVATYGDLWWGGFGQNGWGVAISQQYRTLFSVWYTYDADGKTVWYVIPGGSWTRANTYTGQVFRTTGSPWAGAPYNPAALNAQPVGTVSFEFTDVNNAIMTYTVDGVTGSKPITRQPF